jgi:tetratricopeptide (TPR) repeat protein
LILLLLRRNIVLRVMQWLRYDIADRLARYGRHLTQTGQLDAAEALLAQALLLWPQNGHVALNYAFVAEARGDPAGHLERWRTICDRHAGQAWAHAGFGSALRKLRRLEQAREVVQAAQQQFPDDLQLAVEAGWLMIDLGELARAVELWQAFTARFPDRLDGPLGQATALRGLLRFDEADAVLEAAMRRFPGHSVLATNHATVADLRGDRLDALARWRRVVEQFPGNPVGYAGVGAALKMLGDFSAANAVLADAMVRFPTDSNIAINHAWVAEAERDWSAALLRWRALLARYPDHPVIRNGVSEAAMKAALAALDQAGDGGGSAAPPERAVHEDAQRHLLMRFEALGENCELGFVQRHFGAEPLGLLRWAGMSNASLIAALDTAFAGVGDPEYTIMGLNPHNHEYYTSDLRYGMNMHTFLHEGEEPQEKIYRSMCRRLLFLKNKLLRDLAAAEKIFVYSSACRLSEQDLAALVAALRRHGAVTLLHVCPAGGLHQPGEVILLDDGLLVGFLGRVGYDGKRWDILFDQWLTICERAVALHTASVHSPAESLAT